MKDGRVVLFVVAAVGLLLAGLAAGVVLAQGGVPTPSSADSVHLPPDGGEVREGGLEADAPAPAVGSSSANRTDAPAGPFRDEEEPVGPNAPVPEYNTSWRVLGSALKPRESDVEYRTNFSGGCAYVTSGDYLTVWNTPLWLPPGAQVERVRMYFVDNDATSDTIGWFSKYDLYGNLVNEWPVGSSGSPGQGYATVQISPTEVIDYDTYSYALNWRPCATGNTIQLCGFRTYYTAPPLYARFLPTSFKEVNP